jgi:hypothetical protein
MYRSVCNKFVGYNLKDYAFTNLWLLTFKLYTSVLNRCKFNGCYVYSKYHMSSFNGSVGIVTIPKAKESFLMTDMLLLYILQTVSSHLPCIISEPWTVPSVSPTSPVHAPFVLFSSILWNWEMRWGDISLLNVHAADREGVDWIQLALESSGRLSCVCNNEPSGSIKTENSWPDYVLTEHAVAWLVGALCYKPEVRDSSLGEVNEFFQFT